jgi:hypothetical protein
MQLAGPESPDKHISPNMLRCVQRLVRASRAQLTVKQLQDFDIDSSFGSPAKMASGSGRSLITTTILKMNFILICTVHSLSVATSMRKGTLCTSISHLLGFFSTFCAKSPAAGFFS